MVRVRRRRRGFERAGALPPAELGLPVGRARQLVLARAWSDAVGEAVAGRAPVLGLRRGVLDIGIPEGPWGATLREIVPALVARLAARHPALGVTRYRLVVEGSPARGASTALPPQEEKAPPPPAPRAPRRCVPQQGTDGEAPLEERLRQLMERYVARYSE